MSDHYAVGVCVIVCLTILANVGQVSDDLVGLLPLIRRGRS